MFKNCSSKLKVYNLKILVSVCKKKKKRGDDYPF